MNPKISVIVPMYNVEKYLHFCISSILNQTMQDFEIILVDDCSTDRTVEIAKSFRDSRIMIIENEKNFGMPGPVRNIGLERACGEYIYFMDSDDAIVPDALEILINLAEKHVADVVSSISYFSPVNNEFQSFKDTNFIISKLGTLEKIPNEFQKKIIQEFCQGHGSCLMWQKLFNHSFLKKNNIKFRNVHCEDQVFLLELLCATDKILKFDRPFYIYRSTENSESRYKKADLNKLRHRVKNLSNVADVIENVIPKAIQAGNGGGYFLLKCQWCFLNTILTFIFFHFVTLIGKNYSSVLKKK